MLDTREGGNGRANVGESGSRKMRGSFAEGMDLQIATPIIVKYRDEKTDSATALEDALR